MKKPGTYIGLAFLFTIILTVSLKLAGLLLIAVPASVLLIFFIVKRDIYNLKNISLCFIGIALAFFSLFNFYINNKNKLSYNSESEYTVIGKVLNYSIGNNEKYTLKIKTNTDETLLFYGTGQEDLLIGEKVKLKAKFMDTKSNKNFDLNRYYKGEGIDAVGNIVELQEKQNAEYLSPLLVFNWINNSLQKAINQYLPEKENGIVVAMLLGNTNELDDNLSINASYTSTSHIFAISGLHIGIIAVMLSMILSAFKISKSKKEKIILICIWCFALITGLKLPVLRAAIMFTFATSSKLFGYEADSFNSLVVTGMVLIIFSPYIVFSLSFWLTFSATAGIIVFPKKFKSIILEHIKIKGEFLNRLIDNIVIICSANLAILPIITFYFKGINLLFIITNLIIVELVPIILVMGILLVLVSPFKPVGAFIGIALTKIVDLLIWLEQLFSNIKYTYIGLDYDFYRYFMIIVTVIIIALILRNKDIRIVLKTFGMAILCFIIILSVNYISSYNNFKIDMLASNNENNILITTENKHILVVLNEDKYTYKNILNTLRNRNIYKLDMVIYKNDIRYNENAKNLASKIDINMTFCYSKNYNSVSNVFKNNVTVLDKLSENEVYNYNNKQITIANIEKFYLKLKTYENTVVFTDINDYNLIEKTDYLFYIGNFQKNAFNSKAKYVILLKNNNIYENNNNMFYNINKMTIK